MKMYFPYRRKLTQQGEKPGSVLRASILMLAVLLAVGMDTQSFAQLSILSPADSAVLPLHRQSVIVRSAPGSMVELYTNGVLATRGNARVDGMIQFVNVPVHPGDVIFEVRQLDPDDTIVSTQQHRVHILGPVAVLKIETEKSEIGRAHV